MSLLSDLQGYLRFASGVRAFLRKPLSIEKAQEYVRDGLRERSERFLNIVRYSIFEHPESPYFQLFQIAGCEFGDVEKMVRKEGVRGTLLRLFEAGIYVTQEEFKGRSPVVRGSRSFDCSYSDFDNPLMNAHYKTTSGGTRGAQARIGVDLEHLEQTAPHWALWFAAHDLLTKPLLFWTPNHPGIANRHLICAKFGKRYDKWFGLVDVHEVGTWKDRLAASGVHSVLRLTGGFSRPEFVSFEGAARVAEYLRSMVEAGMEPSIITSPSAAVRASLAAQKSGFRLHGVHFLLGAEPLTASRRKDIEESGAHATPTYGSSESGTLGHQCPQPPHADDVHVCLDAFEVISGRREISSGEDVQVIYMTSLRTASPRVLLNADIGDCGEITTKECGCPFDELGYFRHIHRIRSYEKLSGHEVTLDGEDLFQVVEELLPKKFGGTSAHYQLVETNGEHPRYFLLVDPEIPIPHEDGRVRDYFLGELGKRRSHYGAVIDGWKEQQNLEVRRHPPVSTPWGKIFAFIRTTPSRLGEAS